jgi:predicted glycosyltransferase
VLYYFYKETNIVVHVVENKNKKTKKQKNKKTKKQKNKKTKNN